MNAASAATKLSSVVSNQKVSVETLEDILYEILSTGLEPSKKELGLEDIEKFLHEHARSAKSKKEFLDFFSKVGLSTDPDVYIHPSGIHALTTPTSLKKLESQPPFPLGSVSPNKRETDSEDTQETVAGSIPKQLPGVLEKSAQTALRRAWVFGLTMSVMVVLLFGLTMGLAFLLYQDIRTEIAETKSLQRQNVRSVDVLQRRLTNLQIGVNSNAQSNLEIEKKVNLLTESLVPEIDEPYEY